MNQHHGQMKWTKKFDSERYALFECNTCPCQYAFKVTATGLQRKVLVQSTALHDVPIASIPMALQIELWNLQPVYGVDGPLDTNGAGCGLNASVLAGEGGAGAI